MGCFQVRYDSRVVIYERKLFIRLATVVNIIKHFTIVIYNSRVVIWDVFKSGTALGS